MVWLIEIAMRALPGPVQRRIPPAYAQLLAQMLQFGVVGVIGFGVDTAVVYALRAGTGLYSAGVFAYLAAVTTTWWINRIWTFRGLANIGSLRQQWARYAIASVPGLVLNLGSYFALIAGSPLCATYPVLAVAAGAVAGMSANFILSRALVFR